MRVVFQQELSEVNEKLVEISEKVLEAVKLATIAFTKSDVGVAESVIENDKSIDQMVSELDEHAISLLAMQQPVAKDLRIIVSALRMSSSLARMGDIAEHIAQLARYRYPDRVIPKGFKKIFKEMAEIDIELTGLMIELIKTENLDLIDRMRDLDDRMDELHAGVYEKVLSDTFQGEVTNVVDATLASQYYERFADHIISIAQKVRYLATGDFEALS